MMPTTSHEHDRSFLRRWCETGSDAAFVTTDDTIGRVIDHFRVRPDCRILPVIDAAGQVVGAIFEEDIRQILFNPYGHALLQNPGISNRLQRLVKPCPMAAANASLAVAMQAHAAGENREGLILTDGGRLAGVLLTRTLVRLAAAEAADHAQAQARRMERMAAVSRRFEAEADDLAVLLARVAGDIRQASMMAVDRATGATTRASAVVDAGRQGTAGIEQLADESRALVSAFDQLTADTAHVHAASAQAVDAVRHGTAQTDRLAMAARSIEGMLALIQSLAKKLNLLSLNATIEAARAGEAGRGFTVVAAEVRTLSGQTRRAADEISGEIRDILAAVDDVAQSQQAMQAVVTSVDGLAETVDATVAARRVMTDRIASNAECARAMAVAMVGLLDEVDGESRVALGDAGRMEGLARTLSANAARFGTVVGGFVSDMQAA